jgi:formylglycine-generating enzyme required for sulfatase activity
MAYCDWRCVQERVPAGTYRLPTEDEWEYAARGGLVGRRYPWGNADPVRADIPRACFSGLSLTGTQSRTCPVGSFPPNGFGLFDMAGNVYEWCLDEWRGPVGTNAPASATGLAVQRAWRGGSWASKAPQLQCDAGGGMSQMQWLDTIGFRCVRQ